MLEKSFGLLFFLRKPKNYKSGPIPIYLKLTVDGSSKELSVKRKCVSSDWNAASGRLIGKKESIRELNYYLDSLEQKVYQAKRKLIDNDQEITAEGIKDILTGADEHKIMTLEVFEVHNRQMKALEGIEYSGNTITRYETTLNHVRAFIKWKYFTEDIEIKKLDYEFIDQFSFWFKTVQKCNHNSTMKYLSNFKKIILSCVKKRQLPSDPFAEFKFTKNPVEKIALTDYELEKLRDKNFCSDRLEHVRDIFLFCCYTGLSYADVEKLKYNEVVKGMDGGLWIFTNRQKTNSTTRVPLLPEANAILQKYKTNPKCLYSGHVLPVLSNQKMNSYLKEIASIAGVHKELTFHISRHTFATTITLNNGVPIESVSKMLGHSNIKQTQHYAKLTDKKVSEDMRELQLKRKATA